MSYGADTLKMGPDSKIHGANMGPTWDLSVPYGPHEPCYQGGEFGLSS